MRLTLLLILLLIISGSGYSQDTSPGTNNPDPKIAFLMSLAMPGWGHHYVDKSNWTRGQFHLAAEAGLVLSYVGLRIHSNNLQQNWYTYARSEAGVDVEGRERNFRLAVGNFESLQAYNDYQERSRNWNLLYDDIPENRWSWTGTDNRSKYRDLRERFETIDQQLPALLSLMVVNRVVSAISAYNRARKQSSTASVHFAPYQGISGIVGHLRIRF
jgi:hypothetical protein